MLHRDSCLPLGGQFLSKRISFKTINYLGGLLFLLFALVTLLHQEMPFNENRTAVPPSP